MSRVLVSKRCKTILPIIAYLARIVFIVVTTVIFSISLLTLVRLRNKKLFTNSGFGLFFAHGLISIPELFIEVTTSNSQTAGISFGSSRTFVHSDWNLKGLKRMFKEEILENERRQKIYAAIKKNPGLHIRELQRLLDIPLASLQYHLNYMARRNVIVEEKAEHYTRYYCTPLDPEDKKILSVLRQKEDSRDCFDTFGKQESEVSFYR